VSAPAQNPRLAAARRAHILSALSRAGAVRVTELSAELDVAAVTLRRDLQLLEAEGLLVRVHGGAVATQREPGAVAPRVSADGVLRPAGAIGVLVPSLNYYWPEVVRGMEARAGERGASVLLRGTSYELQDERPVLARMVEEGASGFILAPNTDTAHSQDVLEWLADTRLPYVLVERDATPPGGSPAESVTTDHAHGAVLAARHLASLGHRKVGLVISRNSPTSRKIVAGWNAACRELGLTPGEHVERVLPDRSTPEFSATVHAILDTVRRSGITALLVHSDPEAMAFVDLALSRGLTVPGDLSIVAYDDEVAQLFTPALTAVAPPRAAVGRAAVDLLLDRLADPSRPTHRVVLNPALHARASSGPQR
jgi:DNA-binding LacI/PurR family transcriptional regulator/predicted transcriptional regulator